MTQDSTMRNALHKARERRAIARGVWDDRQEMAVNTLLHTSQTFNDLGMPYESRRVVVAALDIVTRWQFIQRTGKANTSFVDTLALNQKLVSMGEIPSSTLKRMKRAIESSIVSPKELNSLRGWVIHLLHQCKNDSTKAFGESQIVIGPRVE